MDIHLLQQEETEQAITKGDLVLTLRMRSECVHTYIYIHTPAHISHMYMKSLEVIGDTFFFEEVIGDNII